MKKIKIVLHLALIMFSLFLLTGCPFWETEGEVKIVNNGSDGPITSVNIDTDCTNGWSSERNTNIGEGGSRSYEVDAGDYDIRACTSAGCTIWFSEWVDWDETITLHYYNGYVSKQSSC